MKRVIRDTFTHGSVVLYRDNYGYYVSVIYHRYRKHKLTVAKSFSAYYGSGACECALYAFADVREYLGRIISTAN